MNLLKKRVKFRIVFWVLFYIFLFFLLLNHSLSYFDPDFGWHLRVGEEIHNTHLVPSINHYNYTFFGSWVDHEWLSNYFIYLIYSIWGYITLSIVFVVIIIASLLLLTIFVKNKLSRAPDWLIMSFQLFGIIAAMPHFGLRVQEIGVLFILLLIIDIYLYSKTKKIWYLFFLPIFFFIWANLHASFLLGLFLLISFLLIKIFNKYIGDKYLNKYIKDDEWSYRTICLYSFSIVFSIIGTLLTPYHLKLYSFLSTYQNTFYLSHIQEWLSQFNFPFQYWQLLYLAIIGTFLILYFLDVFYYRKKKIDIWEIFLVLLFFVLSFKSRRHFPILFIVSFPFLISNITKFFNIHDVSWDKFKLLLKWFIFACLFLSTISLINNTKFISNPLNSYCDDYPCQAVDFFKKHKEYKGNLFNEYVWGGFLIGADYKRKIFIDGRLPQVRFAGHTFLEEYLSFFDKKANYDKKLNQYNINLILIKEKDDVLGANKIERFLFRISNNDLIGHNYLRDYLISNNKWIKIYQDSTAVVYYRKE